MRLLITRKLPDLFIQQLDGFEVTMHDDVLQPMPKEALFEQAKHHEILITMLSDRIDRQFLEANQHLKAIINLAVGYDNIDIAYASALGIIVCNTPDVLTETTAELGFTLMLSSARRIIEANEMIKNGEWIGWSPYLLAGTDVFNKTVGIYGMGKIGLAFARRCQGFNMNILYHNRTHSKDAHTVNATYVDFDTLLHQSDFVICCAPLTEENKGIFNRLAFNKMKSSAYFINIGRGAHVNEEDLLYAIQNGDILGAGLDVFCEEPMKKTHPFVNEKRITILPHIGSSTVATRNAMIQLCIDNAINIKNQLPAKTPINQ